MNKSDTNNKPLSSQELHDRLTEITEKLKMLRLPAMPGEAFNRTLRKRIKLTRERVEIYRKLEKL
ncbi:hypothetical protein [Alkaliflexus imshenetskii]|uniref:hypothetical protein n=1 Tax=Alkaliflexus imshenetskii TaxID=286730 RepID=UPI000479C0A0|nr:hypothetical protein [Alkaliflexus imshenetskii]